MVSFAHQIASSDLKKTKKQKTQQQRLEQVGPAGQRFVNVAICPDRALAGCLVRCHVEEKQAASSFVCGTKSPHLL